MQFNIHLESIGFVENMFLSMEARRRNTLMGRHFASTDLLTKVFLKRLRSLMILTNLCIDDSEIWRIQYVEDRKNSAHVAWMEENWPNGRPEDFDYQ